MVRRLEPISTGLFADGHHNLAYLSLGSKVRSPATVPDFREIPRFHQAWKGRRDEQGILCLVAVLALAHALAKSFR